MRLSRYFNGPLLTAAFATLVFTTGAVIPVQAQQDGRATISEVQASEPEAPGKFESPAYIIEEAGVPDFGREAVDGSLRIEVEPNNSAAQAESIDPVAGAIKIRGEIQPLLDTDWFAFSALAGDRVYAGTVTHFAGGGTDTFLAVIASDGTTVIEEDDNDGGFSTLASTVANVNIPADGTYYLRVRSSATGRVAPYDLYAHVRRGTPTPETEPNEIGAGGQVIPPSQWVSGYLSAVSPTESDFYTNVTAQPGDTIVAFLDMDPDRAGGTRADGRLGIATFGNPGLILVVNRATNTGFPAPPAEAFYMTVKDAGTYGIYVDAPTATGTGSAGSVGNYTLSVAVIPAQLPSGQCSTYASGVIDTPLNDANVNGGLTEFTLAVPDSFRIGDADMRIRLNHLNMPDLDVVLVSPQGTPLPVFTDVGSNTQTGMDVVLDDEGALSLTANFAAIANQHRGPEAGRRLAVFDGQDSQGTWTLRVYDDLLNNVGTLNEWSIRLCAAPPPPVCAAGFAEVDVYATDFETNDGGFTTDANAPFVSDWARGLPTTPALNRCNGGSANCFVTNLTGNYANGAAGNPLSENLRSPAIDLSGFSPPVTLYWAHAHQLESVTFDRITATAQEPGGLNPMVFYRSNNPTIGGTSTSVGPAPAIQIPEHYGWGEFQEDLSAFAGGPVELEFNLLSDDSVPREGWGIDDIRVTACEQILDADLSITKTDGETTVNPGQTSTYTIVASNAGPGLANGSSVADTFPAALTGCTWTCTGAGGGTCAAAGSGNILESVDLPSGGSVTFIATCTVSPSASGSIVNTATVTAPAGFTDPNLSNNSATDTNTVNTGPGGADVSLVIVNDRNFVQMGENVSLTVAVQNSGPDAAPAVTISGTVPAELTLFSWTCTALGGATCGAPSGIGSFNTTANLPNGGTVLYAVQGTVAGEDANGSVAFTATAVVGPPVVDPNTANNTDTWDAEVVIFRNGFECTVAGVEGSTGCAPPPPVTTVLVDEFTNRYQTAATGGFGGAPVSALQQALGLNVFGAGAQVSAGNWVADDFVVPAGGWTVERMRFYTYQTGSTVASTISDLRLRIYATDPNTGTLVFGDTSTNRLTSTSFTSIYRVLESALTNNQRPTMEMVAEFNPPIVLPAGTYWFTWQAAGSLTSGPWAPPQTVVGQTNTGNGQQSINNQPFAPYIDTGTAATPQGFPFIIEGLQ